MCALTTLGGAQGAEAEWVNVLGGLGIDEAAVLPQEPGGGSYATTIYNHGTHHLARPAPRQVFRRADAAGAGVRLHMQRPARRRAGTQVEGICHDSRATAGRRHRGHAQRGDYSRWVAEVFGDHLLAKEIRNAEKHFCRGQVTNLSESLTKLVRARYELSASWRTGRWHSGENLGVRMLGDRDYCGMLHPPFGGDRVEVTRAVFDLGDILTP